MENQRQRRSRRLLLVPSPFQGHISPMLQLATILHSKGFAITVAHTQFNFPSPSNHPNLLFLPIVDGLSCDAQISSKNFVAIASTLNTNCLAPLRELLLQLTKENGKIACIIYDGFMYCTDSVAKELNLPSIVFRTSSATNVLAYHAFAQLQRDGYLPLQASRSWELVPELHPLRFRDLPIFNIPNSDAMLEQIGKTIGIRSYSGVIWNTVECMEGPSLDQLKPRYQVPFFRIGPLHKIHIAQGDSFSSKTSFLREDYSCMAWLNKQSPGSVVYVSLGSIACWDEKELNEMAWGLANSRQHFLWVIRPTEINITVSEWAESLPEDVKEGVAERGCIVKWAPQKDVLAHKAVGGFWSHCGWNSTLESLWEGVPLICQPQFGDQRVNARLLSHVWRVGVEWSYVMERGEIESAVRRLMVNPEGKEMRQKAVELKDKIRHAVGDGGSSFNALNDLVDYLSSLK